MNTKPLVIAHRGASHIAPENTIAAFELAIEQNADGIETDVYMTQDGEIVCIHDPSTKRTGLAPHEIIRTPFPVIKNLDVGIWKGARFREQRIPRLAELMDWLPKDRFLFLEIKDGLRILEPLRKLLKKSNISTQQLRLMSFQPDIITACAALMPRIQTHWIVDYKGFNRYRRPDMRRISRTLLSMGASGINSRGLRRIVTPHWVRYFHKAGYSAHVWTVNRADHVRYFIRCGIDSITTDVPDLVRTQVDTVS